ncbi:hypothetical protein ASE00_11335 [Sphingomonas sp. Root710]|uniref:hypothetical protein n=1 Tax=Sphingomonas sp. Root710 TaxID=1736594 RepID=UPI0007012BF9|nr:hypothetical protein [Sphingomonas sp. Root710]KRB82626.1 hypothetical protein ASE00_11335 [Sphingomonas sp. Root710]
MRFGSLTLAAALLLATPALAEVPIDPGQTATIRLSPQGELAYPVAPVPPHAPANHGAILSVDIDEPGLYHVALGAPGWIDVYRDGKPLASTGHRHGEPGSSIAKIVDFELAVGHYTLALSGMTGGEVSVSVSR